MAIYSLNEVMDPVDSWKMQQELQTCRHFAKLCFNRCHSSSRQVINIERKAEINYYCRR